VLHSHWEFLQTPLLEQAFGHFDVFAPARLFFSCAFKFLKLNAFNCFAFPPISKKLVAPGACCNNIFFETIDSQAAP
jgi:hypothetical protein